MGACMLLIGSFTAACRAALRAAIAIAGRYFVLLKRELSIRALIAAKLGSFTLVLALPRICRQIYCTDFPRLAASVSYLRNFCALSEANAQSTIPSFLLETFNANKNKVSCNAFACDGEILEKLIEKIGALKKFSIVSSGWCLVLEGDANIFKSLTCKLRPEMLLSGFAIFLLD